MKLLKPIEFLYHCGSGVKNKLYDLGLLVPAQLPVPVISIGNLSFGGSGKTPFTVFLAQELTKQKKIVIVCRSYKTKLTSPRQVDLQQPQAAQIYGDEACLLQKLLPLCEVWSGPNKRLTAQASLKSKPDLILIDDGFSHRQLKRDLDFILIDASSGLTDYHRESMSSLSRAHMVVLTKTHLVSRETVEALKNRILNQAKHLKNYIFISTVEVCIDFSRENPIFAFCGLAKPDSFWNDLRLLDYNIIERLKFADHHAYSAQDQKKILARYLDLKNETRNLKLLCTAKDAIKLTHDDLLKYVHIAQHQIKLDSQAKEIIFGKIRQIL